MRTGKLNPPAHLLNIHPTGETKKFSFDDGLILLNKINYNKQYEPAVAMIVDGKVVHKGQGIDEGLIRRINLEHFSPLNTL